MSGARVVAVVVGLVVLQHTQVSYSSYYITVNLTFQYPPDCL